MNGVWQYRRGTLRAALALAAACVLAAPTAAAQDYPARPLKMIVPFPPSGSTDIVARLGAELQKLLAAPEVIDKFTQAGVDVASSTPEQMRNFLRKELEQWDKVVRKIDLGPK